MDLRCFTIYSLGKVDSKPENPILRTTFPVGREYKCTMVLDCGAMASGASGYFRAEWEPALPSRRLSKAEMRDYRAGRDAFLALAASAVGGSVAIAEV
jgi:hypothetical protein